MLDLADIRGQLAARRALEIDPHAPEVQTSLALLAIGRDWDLPEAIRRLALAVELDHGQVQSRIYHAWVLVLLGQHEAALNLAHDAQELDPTSLLVTSGVAYTCFLARAYAAGVEACERSLEQDPDFIIAMYVKGMCRAQQGEFSEAIQLLERAVAMSGWARLNWSANCAMSTPRAAQCAAAFRAGTCRVLVATDGAEALDLFRRAAGTVKLVPGQVLIFG